MKAKCANFSDTEILSFLLNGYNWRCTFSRLTDTTEGQLPSDKNIDKRYKKEVKTNLTPREYKILLRSSMSKETLLQVKQNFTPDKFYNSELFWDKIDISYDDNDNVKSLKDDFSKEHWDTLKDAIREKFIPPKLNIADTIDVIITTALAIITKGSLTISTLPQDIEHYEYHTDNFSDTSLEDNFANIFSEYSRILIDGEKYTGKTTFAIHSLPKDSTTIIYTSYSNWKSKLIFLLDAEIWKYLNIYVPLGDEPDLSKMSLEEYINIRGCSAYLPPNSTLIIDNIPIDKIDSVINNLNIYTGHYIAIADNIVPRTNKYPNHITISPLSCTNWIHILSTFYNVDNVFITLFQEIYNCVNGEMHILKTIEDTMRYLQISGHNDKILDFVYKVHDDLLEEASCLSYKNVSELTKKYRVTSAIDSSATTFDGHIKKALKYIDLSLSTADKQILYFLIMTHNANFALNELQEIYNITKPDFANLSKTGWISIENNIIRLKMSPYIMQLVVSFDDIEVKKARFNACYKYIERNINNFIQNIFHFFPGRNLEIFKNTYKQIISELLATKSKKTTNIKLSATQHLVTEYIIMGLYYSYNCGDIVTANTLFQYDYSLSSYKQYKIRTFENIIPLFMKDINWIENPKNDWLISGNYSDIVKKANTFTPAEKEIFDFIISNDIERNLFYIFMSKDQDKPIIALLFEELINNNSCFQYHYKLFMLFCNFYSPKNSITDIASYLKESVSIIKDIEANNTCPKYYIKIKIRVFACLEMIHFIDHCNGSIKDIPDYEPFFKESLIKIERAIQQYEYKFFSDYIYFFGSLMCIKKLLNYPQDDIYKSYADFCTTVSSMGFPKEKCLNCFFTTFFKNLPYEKKCWRANLQHILQYSQRKNASYRIYHVKTVFYKNVSSQYFDQIFIKVALINNLSLANIISKK